MSFLSIIISIKKLIFILLVMVPTLAFTQDAPKEFNLKVNSTDIQLLGEALGMLPYGKVAPLMQRLQIQINEQNQVSKPVEIPKPTQVVPK